MNITKPGILFVCLHNSARSQIAEAFMQNRAGADYVVESAGFVPGNLNPLAVQVMQEIGFDLAEKTTKSVFDLFRAGRLFKYVITVCDESSAERCPIFPGMTHRLHWSFPDPSSFSGPIEDKLVRTREVRDEIRRRVDDFYTSELKKPD